MKIKYTTTRDTAVILKEWASNCGSALKGSHLSTRLVQACQEGRDQKVESFMQGTVEAADFSPESVLLAMGPAARHIREHTMTRLAATMNIEPA